MGGRLGRGALAGAGVAGDRVGGAHDRPGQGGRLGDHRPARRRPGLFQPRPSAAGDGYDLLSTYGSNYGPESPELIASIKERKAEVAEREGVEESQVPPDAVTASGSGLDPDISVEYAELQVPRVAAANDLTVEQVQALVDEHTSGRTLGVLGEPRVNVLLLNIAVLALGD